MKITLISITFLSLKILAWGQFSEKYVMGITSALSHGFLITHYPHMKPLARGPVRSFELGVALQTTGKESWHNLHNFPLIHFNYTFFDFSNREQIGFVHSILPTMSLQTTRHKHFYHSITLGVGLGYFERPHDRITNNKNAAIGSHFNGFVRLGSDLGFRINSRLNVTASLNFNHWSNGSMKVPNLGMNVPSVSLRADYFLKDRAIQIRDKSEKINFDKKINWIATAALGIKQVEPLGSGNFTITTLQFDGLKAISSKNSLGFGIDFFFNEGIRQMMINTNQMFSTLNYFRSGIHIAHQFRVGNFATLFNVGAYYFKLDNLDKFLYNRIGFRYFFDENIHFNLSLKSHYFVADHFEFGVGFKLK